MPDHLPPLTALRAFEAAARHMSFARAADELAVTPAALSFQIKSLEEHLGQPLFHRLNRAVSLTEAGRALAPGAEEGFRTLTAAWRTARRISDTRSLNVTAGPGFTAKWLAPRFYDFARAHPEIELRFSATLRLLDFYRDEVDVAIRFGRGPYEGLYARPLAQEWLTPVMVPELASRYRTPDTLGDAPLLFDDSLKFLGSRCTWPAWFAAAGIAHGPLSGPHFSQADHVVDAALAGAGIALGRRAMVVKDISEGRLVAPFDLALSLEAQFHFVCRQGDEDRPAIAALREWIYNEIDKTEEVTEALTILQIEDIPLT